MDPVAFARFLGLEAIVSGQGGVVRRDQALAAGMTSSRIDDLVRRGRWLRIMPRVFAVDVDPRNPRVRIRGIWLWAGDHSVIAGEAAAWWLGLAATAPRSVVVVVPPPARRAARPGVQAIRGFIDPADADFEDWIRVTTIARTCLDLARAGLPDNLDTALRRRRLDQPKLQQTLSRGRGSRGQIRARLAVRDVGTNPWSPAERLAHRRLCAAGITGWTANPPVRLRSGVRHPDIAIEDIKLAIEIDGRAHHSSPAQFEHDRIRQNEFVEAGWTVLVLTWKQLTENHEQAMATVRATIERLRHARSEARGEDLIRRPGP